MDLKKLFADTPKKHIYLLLGLMGGALIVGWYMVLYTPAKADRVQAMHQKNRIEQDLVVKRQLRHELPKLQKRQEELQDELARAVRKLPDEKEIPNLLTQVNRLGQDAGLVFTLFKPGTTKRDEFVNEIPIIIKAEGDYHALGRFFDVNITDLKMDQAKTVRGRTGGGTISGEFTATTYTFAGTQEAAPDDTRRGRRR